MTIATEHKFGEIMNDDSGSSTSLEYTRMKQLNWTCLHGSKYKGEGFLQIMGNLPFGLASL